MNILDSIRNIYYKYFTMSTRYFIRLLILFSIANVLSGCTGNANIKTGVIISEADTLYKNGYFNSLNKSNQLVLYKTLYPNMDGEEKLGDLLLWDIKSNKSSILIDSIPINIPKSLFVTDSLILVPNENNIFIYELANHLIIDKIFDLTKDDLLLGFSLKSDRKDFTSILVNYKTKSSELVLYNLDTYKKKSINIPFDFDYSEYYPPAEFYWTDKGIVFSIQNSLYLYNPLIDKIATITDSLELQFDNTKYFLDDNNIVFKAKKSLYIFSLNNMNISKINSFEPDDNIEFFTCSINNTLKGFVLNKGSYFKFENMSFIKTTRLPLIESDSVLIYKVPKNMGKFFIRKK